LEEAADPNAVLVFAAATPRGVVAQSDGVVEDVDGDAGGDADWRRQARQAEGSPSDMAPGEVEESFWLGSWRNTALSDTVSEADSQREAPRSGRGGRCRGGGTRSSRQKWRGGGVVRERAGLVGTAVLGDVLKNAGDAVEAAEQGGAEAGGGAETEHGEAAGEDLGGASGLVEGLSGLAEREGIDEDGDAEGEAGHADGGEEGGEDGEDCVHGSNVGPLFDCRAYRTVYVRKEATFSAVEFRGREGAHTGHSEDNGLRGGAARASRPGI